MPSISSLPLDVLQTVLSKLSFTDRVRQDSIIRLLPCMASPCYSALWPCSMLHADKCILLRRRRAWPCPARPSFHTCFEDL
jgi:hypothetical protein